MDRIKEAVENILRMTRGKHGPQPFIKGDGVQMEKLRSLFGYKELPDVYRFFRDYQPNELPMLDSYVRLLDIDDVIMENTSGEPGRFMAEYGVYTFAVTVGGNVICIDTNDLTGGEPAVLIAGQGFCSVNDYYGCVEIARAPEAVAAALEENELLTLSYGNIKRCLPRVADTFGEFLYRLSLNEYGNLEERYLP